MRHQFPEVSLEIQIGRRIHANRAIFANAEPENREKGTVPKCNHHIFEMREDGDRRGFPVCLCHPGNAALRS